MIRQARPSTSCRDKKIVRRFFKKEVGRHGLPFKVTIDKSGGLEVLKKETGQVIEIRQIKYLNNIVKQDHWQLNGSFAPCSALKPSIRPAALCVERTIANDQNGKMMIIADGGKK